MDYEHLIVECTGEIAHIRINRPQARNALNQELRLELNRALNDAQQDLTARVIVLSAAGETFCAGADLTERLPGSDQDGFVIELLRREYNPIIRAITKGKKPVIGAINGAAAGIGMSIALACDLLVMAQDACLYSAFGKISLVPDGGAHWFLARAIGTKLAYEMIALSQQLDAQTCQSLGLANRVVSPQALMDEALTLAAKLAQCAPLTLSHSKQLLSDACEQSIEQLFEAEAQAQNLLLQSNDFKEGSLAFFERRTPDFKGN